MASRFWVGGTGTWDTSTTTHWSATTGGANGASAPVTGDTVTIDASSGAGTITTNFGGTLSLSSLTTGAMGMTLDFSANNDSLTCTSTNGWQNSGAGVRTVNLGSGTFTLPAGYAGFTAGNLTLNAGTSTILINPSTTSFNPVFQSPTGKSFNIVRHSPTARNMNPLIFTGSITIATLELNGNASLTASTSITTTSAFTMNGATGAPLSLYGVGSGSTLALGTSTVSASWVALVNMTVTASATPTINNSFDCGGNTGVTINQPSGGSSGMLFIPNMDGV